MQKFNWNYPTTIWGGENRIKDIAEACKTLNIFKPLLVTDKGLSETDIVKKTLLILIGLFTDVSPLLHAK